MKLPSSERQKTPLTSGNVLVRKQAIAWTNVDQVLCRHMWSLYHDELDKSLDLICEQLTHPTPTTQPPPTTPLTYPNHPHPTPTSPHTHPHPTPT